MSEAPVGHEADPAVETAPPSVSEGREPQSSSALNTGPFRRLAGLVRKAIVILMRKARALSASPGARFGGRFVALATVFAVFDVLLVSRLDWVSQATAHAVASATPVLGISGTVLGGGSMWFLGSGGKTFSYAVTAGCTATMPVFLFGAAVLAYPASWRQRGYGLLVGVPSLLGLNVARLVSMAWLGLYAPRLFGEFHLGWWQAIFIVAVGLAWLVWVQALEDRTPGRRGWRAARTAAVQGGVFAAAFTGLWYLGTLYLGTLAPLRAWYGLAAWNSSRFWANLLHLPASDVRPDLEWLASYGVMTYGWVAAAAALFACGPRQRWRRRLAGLVLGAVVGHMAQVVGGILYHHSGTTAWLDAQPLIRVLQLALIGTVWFVWTRPWAARQRGTRPSPSVSSLARLGPADAKLAAEPDQPPGS